MSRGDHAIMGVPEVGGFRVRCGNVVGNPDIEHFPQSRLPLPHQAGRAPKSGVGALAPTTAEA